ncbi:MAG: CFI-box-CTERM domain-containing protein [Dehalococcoidia bacterium]
MSKHLGVPLAALLVVVLFFLPCSGAEAGGWVANQGFEAGEGGFPREWAVTGNASRVNTPPIYSGNWSARLTGEGDTLTQWIGGIVGLTTYEAWGWIYVSGNVTGVIALDFWQEEGGRQLSPTTYLSATNTRGSYRQEKDSLRAQAEATHVRIRLMGEDWASGGEVRFDGIGFYPVRRDCFIATAAYGTPMAEEAQILRSFRDGYMLTNPMGQALVDLYYRVSPPIAELIDEHPGLKSVVRVGLAPAVVLSTVAVNTTPAQKMAALGVLAVVWVTAALWATGRLKRRPDHL